MIFTVKQTFPIERVLFECNTEDEAIDFLDNLILLGDGWFEVWEEGYDMPIQAGGKQAFSPYQPTKWDVMSVICALEKVTETQDYGNQKGGLKATSFKDLPGTH